MEFHSKADMDFYNHAVKVLQTLVNALGKRGIYQNNRRLMYQNNRLRRSHFRNYRAIQRINRERGQIKRLC